MKLNASIKKFLALFFSLTITLFFCVGCEPPDPPVGGPADEGVYSECTFSSGLSDSDYGSAQVFYPCEEEDGPFPATTLTGGFTNTKEQMYWLAEHLVTHGYIVIAITPTNPFSLSATTWENAHKAGISKLISQNALSSSPIYGLVDTDNLQVSGYSYGGGGTLLAANDLGTQLVSVQAFAPFAAGTSLSGVTAATLCIAGGSDTTASPSSVISSYNSLPNTIERTYAEYTGLSHLEWVSADATTRDRLKTYITSWMKVYLDGDTTYEEYIDGNQDWFDEFAVNVDVGGGGCD